MGGGGSKNVDSAMDTGVELDTFQGKYLGSVPVDSAKGTEVCKDAVTRILSMKQAERPVLVRITTLGVFIIDAPTGDVLKSVLTSEVSFVSMDERDPKLISFFENEESLRLITCHTFMIVKNALQLPVTINEAFKILSGQKAAPPPGFKNKRKVSKKEALEEANAGPAIPRGELQQTYFGQYLGSTVCLEPKGDQVITAAAAQIVAQKNKPVEARIQIHVNVLAVIAAASSKQLLAAHVLNVTYAKLSDDAMLFTMIVDNKKFNTITAHAFAVEPLPKDHPSIRRSIDAAQKKNLEQAEAAEAAKRQAQESLAKALGDTSSEVTTGRILGVHEATFLGSVNVSQKQGADVVEDAYYATQQQHIPVRGVFIQLGTECIRLLDALTHEVVANQLFKSISFTCVVGEKNNIFAFIAVDARLGLFTCYLFACAGKKAFDIAEGFGDVFKAISDEQSKVGDNPFAGIGERLVPPEDLFDIQIHRADLRAIKVIGAGNFGQVYLATQQTDNGPVERAVKMLRGGASEADRKAFIREAQTQVKMNHPNLVNLIGVAMQQRPWLMVLEYCAYGDLRGLLKGCQSRNIALSSAEQLNLALHIARGMAFMAKQNFIHLDLAARNCLVAAGTVVQVADFGMSRMLPEDQDFWYSETVLRLPIKWCSIEALDDRIFSEASDVWAFGVTMWEIATYGAMPYEKLKTQEVQRKVREGLRLPKSPNTSEEYHRISSSCWLSDRRSRPTFQQLEERIEQALQSLGKKSIRDVGALLATGM